MSSENAAAIYGLNVPASGERIPASLLKFPVRIHISMAAIDPTAAPKTWNGDIPPKPRSTLKIIRVEDWDDSDDEDDDDEDDDEYLKALINASSDDGEDSEDDSDDEPNGGPSDKSKSKKQKRAEALAELIKAAQEEEDEDEEMVDAKPSGTKASKKAKGKGKATAEEEDEDESEEEEDGEFPFDDAEEFVLCTLDTEQTYQQPLNITINENEMVFFQVTGTHDITLTGNYIDTDEADEDSDGDDYDLDPEQERMMFGDDDEDSDDYSGEESDDLDDIDEPRITEVASDDDEEVPQLVKAAATKKGKNKRPAEEEAEGLDEMIAQEEKKLSKKQLKKLKNNKGDAVAAEESAKGGAKGDKKVQFAKELEQGPTGSASKEAGKEKAGASKGVKVVQGVTIDDRKVGSGRAVKNGDTVGMRYIGKLKDGKQFDANKKGRPFYFKVGKGEVIKGWDVGIMGMQIGGERRLSLPPNMAYGSKALPGIPANSTLVFDVKLLEIK